MKRNTHNVEYDPTTGEKVWEYRANPGAQFYSAQRLSLGNVLICEGTSGRIFEISRQGEYAWEWITPIVSGNDQGDLRTWIYRAYRYKLDHPAFVDQELDPMSYRELNVALGLL
ncbi:MAG: hypothetical protein AAF702_42560 [Chloroflexota bacterium]